MGVQGHQKQWENTKVLMEIDVFVCLVVQEPGVPGGQAPPDPPLFNVDTSVDKVLCNLGTIGPFSNHWLQSNIELGGSGGRICYSFWRQQHNIERNDNLG